MKTKMYLVAISLVIGVAVAQDANRQQNPDNSPPQAGTQAQRTSAQTGIADKQTQSYKGTLVDASCTMSSATPSAAGTQQAPAKSKENKNEANRTAAAENPAQACSISANTTQFALKLNDGRTTPFDSVGNLRAQETIKSKKTWNDAVGSGKPIHAKVSGVMTDDKLMVMSID
jgi:hypothetical protein